MYLVLANVLIQLFIPLKKMVIIAKIVCLLNKMLSESNRIHAFTNNINTAKIKQGYFNDQYYIIMHNMLFTNSKTQLNH